MSKIIVTKGEVYGILTIIDEVSPHIKPSGEKVRKFLCKCNCGSNKEIVLGDLRSGHTKSCGCIQRKKNRERSITHGLTNTKIYKIWDGMNQRCNNTNSEKYSYYGGRGIKIEWKSFEKFYEDMGTDYKEGLQIDRIDNDGNYSKENCRWSTRIQNGRNKRNNILYKGKCLSEWAEITGIKYKTIHMRIKKYGWTYEKALGFE